MTSPDIQPKVQLSDDEWRKKLTSEEFQVLRRAGTERPFTGEYWDNHQPGIYVDLVSGEALFASVDKFDSGTGWPSFWKALDNAVLERPDTSLGMERTEVLCSQCGGHLGHVFNDGPQPTGLRYCMNGVAMTFQAS